jgi:4-hydroxybenzoate polyprenyltransferase
MALWVASRIFISATLFDVGDLAGDLQSKLPTLPVLLGRRRALRLLDLVNLGSALIILSGSAVGLLPPSLSAMALAVSIYGAWFIHRVRTGRQIGFTCDVIVDSEGVFAAATLLGAALLIP